MIRLALARRQSKMTQGSLAATLGVTQPRVSRWETGDEAIPLRYGEPLYVLFGYDLYYLQTRIELPQ